MSEVPSGRVPLGASAPLVPPLYQSSVFTLPDLDALDRIMNGEEPGFIYARDAHPNARNLAARLATLESAEWSLVTSSGMAALSVIFLALTQTGSRVLASNRLYGRSTQLLQQELGRYGVITEFIDTNDLNAVDEALDRPARLILVETISNPLLRVADIQGLARLAHEREALLVVDNTFATPVLTRPLELGADLVMESLTKMIGGHSDVTLGLVAGRGELLPEMSQVSSIWGFASNPFDCWLAERGLDTLVLRMHQASANALALARWLDRQRGVSRVLYPGLRDHPDHRLAGRVLSEAYGNMLCFELAGGREAVNRFLHQAPRIPFSPSLGNTTTTCSHPATTSHRYVSPAEKQRQGISDGLIRLSVGIEPLEALQAEMARGLAS
ncbi:MAG: aminotransferase class I/II-fold pyridoxal phosphate-dependent enzyme [Gemmataceae bacterium]